jgi:hypothetical protein
MKEDEEASLCRDHGTNKREQMYHLYMCVCDLIFITNRRGGGAHKNRGRRINEECREEDCSSDHKLNITDEFIDILK